MTPQTLTIGELAKASATTPRTLRHFEAMGLIRPIRAENGRRVYDLSAVSTLAHVLLLKRMGFSLSEIKEMERRPTAPEAIIDAQLALLSVRKTALERTINQLHATRHLVKENDIGHGAVDLTAFCLLLREGEAALQWENTRPVFEQYFTPSEQREWQKQMDTHFGCEDEKTFYQIRWVKLIAHCEEAIGRKVAPSSPEAQNLVKEWMELQQPLQDAVGPDLWRKAATMYEQMQDWQTPERQAPFSPEVYTFIREAAAQRAVVP
ncbi:MerR family transcriptional regulator [Gluconobacter japonicus]|uniref:MerR family transcriptional regulator n=1 Tax=Gluconobacter japonicus TaxID=376620 RepID=UPI001B8AC380|nr:MerR family transcriptional regulator [Gluconobacter japonicus]MBS1049132.1 MerR family transcriptional regulator [Gluconobacter japonicus]